MRRSSVARALPLAFAPLLAACASSTPDVGPWADTFTCANGQASTYLAADPSGAIALAGFYTGQITLHGAVLPPTSDSSDDVFIGMLNADGTVAWAAASGSLGPQSAAGVAFDPAGAVVAAGQFANTLDFGTGPLTALSTDTFVVKLTHDGQASWAKDFGADQGGPMGGGDSAPAAVATDGSGNIAVGGNFSGTIGFGGGPLFASTSTNSSPFVAKLDGDGGPVFSLDFGAASAIVTALAFDAGGDLYVGGVNTGTLSAGGTTLTTSTSSGYVVKLSPDGVPQWALQLDGDGSTVAALAVDGEGNVLVAASFQGQLAVGDLRAQASSDANDDGLVVQISATGTPLWIHGFGTAPLTAVAAGDGGSVLALGAYRGSPDFGGGPLPLTDPSVLFATRLDGQGRHLRTALLQAPSQDSTNLAQTALGTGIAGFGSDVVVAGTYSGVIEIDPFALAATGAGDLFAARFGL